MSVLALVWLLIGTNVLTAGFLWMSIHAVKQWEAQARELAARP